MLTYSTYLELLSALDEYAMSRGFRLAKHRLQNAILNHYLSKNKYCTAKNKQGTIISFHQYSKPKDIRHECRRFRRHMNKQ